MTKLLLVPLVALGLCWAPSGALATGERRPGATVERRSSVDRGHDPARWSWLRGPRARRVARARGRAVRRIFAHRGVAFPPRAIYIRAFKQERELELWARASDGRYVLIERYGICAASGELGPKRREGDGQVPEGFYRIDRFNPRSSFHLSLGIDYPNRADRLRQGSRAGPLGGEIFIHGACVSIGCMALTDRRIEALYLAAAGARARGQRRVPVHVFPARLDPRRMAALGRRYAGSPALLAFWSELQRGYLAFEATRRPPRVRIDAGGHYRVSAVTGAGIARR